MTGRGWTPGQLAVLALVVVVLMLWLNPWRGAEPTVNQSEVGTCVSTSGR